MNGMRTFVLDVGRRRDLVALGCGDSGNRHVWQRKTALAARSLTDAVGGRTILPSCLFGSHRGTDGAFL